MYTPSSYNAVWDDDEPRTLCDWVKNFRIKKIQMKRKLRSGGDLRICAILSTALLSAEHELRRKQQERFSRWLEMQSKFDKREPPISRSCAAESNITSIGCCAIEEADMSTVSAAGYAQTEQINHLWKSELNSLDEFMRSIGNKSRSAIKNEMLLIQNGDHHHQRDHINCDSVATATTPNSIEVAS